MAWSSGGLAGTGPLLVMLSQDLFGWGLPGEQSVAARLLPLADVSGGTKPKSPLAGMGWERPISTRLAWVCSMPCRMCVWVLLLIRTYLLGERWLRWETQSPQG